MLARVSKLALLLLLTACDPGDVVLLAPDKSPSDAPALTIHAVIDTPYADVANTLEWTAGIPGAQVRMHQMEEPYDESYRHAATADSSALATFVDLLSGLYEVEVTRWLSGPEMVQVPVFLSIPKACAGLRPPHLTPEVGAVSHSDRLQRPRRGHMPVEGQELIGAPV